MHLLVMDCQKKGIWEMLVLLFQPRAPDAMLRHHMDTVSATDFGWEEVQAFRFPTIMAVYIYFGGSFDEYLFSRD